MNVLIVDDDATFRLLMRDVMKSDGWDVFQAEDGVEAIEKLKATTMDFFISDVYMPNMDGIKLHKAVRASTGYGRIPFLFVSGYDDEHTRNCVQDPRVDGFFRKGRPLSDLRDRVANLTVPGKRPVPPSIQ